MNQVAEKILMVRPAAFGFNTETAANNFFQNKTDLTQEQVQQKAVQEFDVMVKGLRSAGIEVWVVEDTANPQKPDAIFPNNCLIQLPKAYLIFFPCLRKTAAVKSGMIFCNNWQIILLLTRYMIGQNMKLKLSI
jgi:hypothetical protein